MTTTLDICVCTFRRSSLADTLQSLHALDLPTGLSARIMVIDNDDAPSAAKIVEADAVEARLPVLYLHRPGRNISLARNAALETSDAEFLAFIDDDETAARTWLTELLATQAETGADIVLGPVEARYPNDAPNWMRRADIHATRPVWVDGEIRTGYSCNVLIHRINPRVTRARFDPAFGRTGGEDSMYFRALSAAGAKIAFAPEAWVYEPVAPERLRLGWLAKRRFRMGQTHAQSLITHDGHSRIPAIALAAAKATICAAMATVFLPNRARSMRDALRACLHAGVVLGLVGHRVPELYGATP